MAKTKLLFIIATFICACVAVAFEITCFATTSWVEAVLHDPEAIWQNHDLNYGLFAGHVTGNRFIIENIELDLSMSCSLSENKCVMSCQTDSSQMENELENLINGNANFSCFSNVFTSGTPDKKFINAGVWISSVVFLVLSLLTSVLAAVFAVINTITNPVQSIAGVFGLYIWNGSAVVNSLLVMILWGSLFANVLVDNVAYSETITGIFVSKGESSLGFSYWLLIIVILLHVANIVTLGIRDYLLAREPPTETVKMDENTDGIIFLY